MARHYRNPYRRVAGVETKTWLPDDAGKFNDPDAPVGFFLSYGGKKGGLRLSKYGDLTDAICIVLPDGKAVWMNKTLGQGAWTTAVLGDDGWVYLFSGGDPAKELLVEAVRETADQPWAVHLPWVERIGVKDDRPEVVVYRMPYYANSLSARNKRITDALSYNLGSLEDAAEVLALRESGKKSNEDRRIASVPTSILLALSYLAYKARARRLLEHPAFDFLAFNFAEDADGVLILLDVITFGAPSEESGGSDDGDDDEGDADEEY